MTSGSQRDDVDVSVIIPTRNRAGKLEALLRCLERQQTSLSFETLVVDDGSQPPVVVSAPRSSVLRLEGVERSAARNAGARRARGRLLLFLDDDLTFGDDLVARHARGFEEWPQALLVGSVGLADEVVATPFGAFRARLERQGIPTRRGLVDQKNFCTAQNLAVGRDVFQRLGGFDPEIVSSEDQDLAMRHVAHGGRIVFLPEARVIHRDDAIDIRSYCRRAEWGMAHLRPFLERHPSWPDNVERARINGPIRLGREPLATSVRKIAKTSLAPAVAAEGLLSLISWLERWVPDSRMLPPLYRLALGVALRRGFQRIPTIGGTERRDEDPSLRRAS